MNIKRNDPPVDWAKLLKLSTVLGQVSASADEYGCPGCLRKSCPGCSERLLEPTVDQSGVPY